MRDWNDEYANATHISGGELFPELWQKASNRFRESFAGECYFDVPYADHPQAKYDVFLAEKPKGALVFVHGGFWRMLDKSYWSHLAQGALANGYDVYIPSYPLCPEVRISQITDYISLAIAQIAKKTHFPMVLAGHSAGGHLVSRMVCADGLDDDILARIERVVPISGLFDLRPLMKTAMNDDFKLDMQEARAQSPALCEPKRAEVFAVVGANERPEFLRQTALIANIWSGFDMKIKQFILPEYHHFTILDEMISTDSTLTRILTGNT